MMISGSRKNIRRSDRSGFTLVELLVATAILAVVMLLVTRMIGDTGKIWSKTTAKIDAFRQARLGFELMTSEMAQATTNTYWDYFNAAGQTVATNTTTPFAPVAYGRQSELHFISGPGQFLGIAPGTKLIFNATQGGVSYTHGIFFTWAGGFTQNAALNLSTLNSLLNATGFFIEFSPDYISPGYFVNGPPALTGTPIPTTYRMRLCQFIEPTESLLVYNYSLPPVAPATSVNPNAWFADDNNGNYSITRRPGHAAYVRIVANNVIALIIWPKKVDTINDVDPTVSGDTALSPYYTYDSRQGLTSGTSTLQIGGGNTTPSATNPFTMWKPGTNSQPLQMNQMPPILNVAMVALDEPSAKTLQGSSTTVPTKITTALNGLFSNAGPPATAPTYSAPDPPYNSNLSYMDNDLAALQSRLSLITPKLNFQIFETTIAIRSAKFSNP